MKFVKSLNVVIKFFLGGMILIFATSCNCFQQKNERKNFSQVDLGKTDAYLFAHMTSQQYGRLYYSVSTDGLNWTMLNNENKIDSTYRGHPDITKGADGRYYLMGNTEKGPDIKIWVSSNLIKWAVLTQFYPDMSVLPEFVNPGSWFGAPKMFYDEATKQYIITFHVSMNERDDKDFEKHWTGMRTLYVLTNDFKTFTKPKRLFQFDIATIDVIIRKEDGLYYAILKDEKHPTYEWPTGKSIRYCTSKSITGEWSQPSSSISPNFREAPTLIPKPDGKGYFLYFEQYPGVQYGVATAPSISGPWYDAYIKTYTMPANARHGCMIPISNKQYIDLLSAFPNKN